VIEHAPNHTLTLLSNRNQNVQNQSGKTITTSILQTPQPRSLLKGPPRDVGFYVLEESAGIIV
jgi:hypothetical protein